MITGNAEICPVFKIKKMAKTIFITGASRGLGKLWAEAFLKRGDNVVATARNIDTLSSLTTEFGDRVLPLQLDVTDRTANFEAVEKAKNYFGKIDVLINNAGYGLFGTVEETSEQEARQQMETNFFGLLWLTQAILPIMRKQKSGHILQVSSGLGLFAWEILGLYAASKFAVEGLSESLAREVKDFGIHVTLIEPNSFGTDWAGPSSVQTKKMPEYDTLRKNFFAGLKEDAVGIPESTVDAILKLVDSAEPPLRLILGKVAYPTVKEIYKQRLAEWEGWKQVSIEAHGK